MLFRSTNAGGNAKYKAGDVVEADELVGADGRSKKKGVEFEPYSYYLSAWEEDNYIIAQANAPLDDSGRFQGDRVDARRAGDFILAQRGDVQFMDVSPKQLVSVAASLVPFLENDDANRAFQGSATSVRGPEFSGSGIRMKVFFASRLRMIVT